MNRLDLKNRIATIVEALEPQLIELRRHFHENPELGREEVETTAYLVKLFESLEWPVVTRENETGLWVDWISDPDKPLLALRCDIDALPIQEKNDVSYVSQKPGLMHACGHDSHITVLAGTVLALHQLKDELSANIRFLFQPAEESTPGGALDMLERGVLDNVEKIIGLHADPWIEAGKIAVKPGKFMASTDVFKIRIIGRGAHAANPHTSIDPILISAEFINALHHVVSRNVRAIEPAVISVTKVIAGTTFNVIPSDSIIWGTMRALTPELRKQLQGRLRQILKSTCEMHGATFEIELLEGAPPVFNNPEMSQQFLTCAEEILGSGNTVELTEADMGAEDFAWYLEKVPGILFRLGTCGRPGTDFELHHPQFDIDEKALTIGVKAFVWNAVQDFIQK